ncbi:MAG: lycopene cyclase family protein, partial [Ilumatobacteraceae bacterium]
VWDAVWPAELRRTRALHDYGLELLARSDAPTLREFFDRFFDLPAEVWAPYLRVDADPAEITRAMRSLFRSASWPMRRRLAAGNPWPLARSLHP